MFFISGKTYLYFQFNNVIQGADTPNTSKINLKFPCTNPNTQAEPSDKDAPEHIKTDTS